METTLNLCEIQAKAALEDRSKVIAEIRTVEADTSLSDAVKANRIKRLDAEARGLEATARDAIERGNREAEVRALAANSPSSMPRQRHEDDGESLRHGMLPSLSEYRALTTTSADAVIPTRTMGQAFDFLRAKSVFLASGPRVFAMDSKTLEVPRISASSSASMVAEGTSIPLTDTTISAVNLTARKAAVLTKATNESVMDSNPELVRLVGEDHMREVARLLDKQFLEGDGSGANMRGLRNFTGVTSTSLGTNGATPTLDNFADCLGRLEQANGDLSNAAWFMSGRTWGTLRKLKDTTNRYLITDQVSEDGVKRLFGVPVYVSNLISITETQGTSTDCSWAGLVDLGQVAVGRRTEITVSYSADAYYAEDCIGIRTTSRWDVAPIDPAGTQLITGIRP
jgi:HK97 family phage major capsid protein